VSDADRESAADFLKAHFLAGRLTEDELDERVDAAYRARSESQLVALTDDLPRLRVPAPPPPRQRHVRPLLMALAALVCTVVLLDAMPDEMAVLFLSITVPMLLMLAVMITPIAVGLLGIAWLVRAVRGSARHRPPLAPVRRQRWLA
jgi:hypothetical protein